MLFKLFGLIDPLGLVFVVLVADVCVEFMLSYMFLAVAVVNKELVPSAFGGSGSGGGGGGSDSAGANAA